MSISQTILCRFNRHQPIRRQVVWAGMTYVGTCKHCGAAIRRKSHGKWRLDPVAMSRVS